MFGDVTRAAVAVAQSERPLASSVARCAMRCRWPVYSQNEPGTLKAVLRGGTRVLVVQLGEAPEASERLISRLSGHFSPVACIAVDVADGGGEIFREIAARRAGAAAYIAAGVREELLMQVVTELERSTRTRSSAFEVVAGSGCPGVTAAGTLVA